MIHVLNGIWHYTVKHCAFNRSLSCNLERTLRGLTSMAGLELDRNGLQRQPGLSHATASAGFVLSLLRFDCRLGLCSLGAQVTNQRGFSNNWF